MKLKVLFLSSLILLFAITTYAQITTGVAIQGIARDGNNTAKTNVSIPLKFSVYYVKSGTTYTPMTQTITLTTDAFGVFSHILDIASIDNTSIFENELFLKIENGTLVISDEKLNYVPYAVSASNGVPTGSIIPYMGITAPKGWVLCNGAVLPSTATALIALVGNNAPDLRGMFMRGAGASSGVYSSNVGPNLKQVQADGIKSHALTVTDNGHEHGISDPGHGHTAPIKGGSRGNGNFANGDGDGRSNSFYTDNNTTGITKANNAKTNITVNYAGITETRPVNYGVNYIIKL